MSALRTGLKLLGIYLFAMVIIQSPWLFVVVVTTPNEQADARLSQYGYLAIQLLSMLAAGLLAYVLTFREHLVVKVLRVPEEGLTSTPVNIAALNIGVILIGVFYLVDGLAELVEWGFEQRTLSDSYRYSAHKFAGAVTKLGVAGWLAVFPNGILRAVERISRKTA